MLRLLKLIFGLFVRSFRARRALLLENLGLRQQLAVLARRRPQPRFWNGDRFLWIVLHRLWSGWRKALILVQPDTVVGWHRAGFTLYWNWISGCRVRVGRRSTSKEIRELIFQMVAENPTWGAPRIHGELKMLGFPDGSFGWAKVRTHLPGTAEMSKLFFDYVGMGDSDKPKDYVYSTAERADFAEAIWRDLGVKSTTLVAFDFSSLVVLEILRRRLERSERHEPAGGPEIRGVLILNGGLFPGAHTHPWYTTPVLRRLPKRAWRTLGRSFRMSKMTMGVMWSKGYKVMDDEIRELLKAINRHDGGLCLAKTSCGHVGHSVSQSPISHSGWESHLRS